MTSGYINFFDELTGQADNTVWIGNVVQGMVVRKVEYIYGKDPNSCLMDVYGHIVGFARANGTNDILITVQWDYGSTHSVHPIYLKLFVPTR